MGDAIVLEVQTILSELDGLKKIQSTYAKDSNSSLIKADVLEWEPGSRFANLNTEKKDLLGHLSTIFDMPKNNKIYSYTPLHRS
jgi:hypothetical protein